MILLEDIAAADLRLGHVPRLKLRDVDSVFVALDFFFEDIDADVIIGGEFAGTFIDEDLDETRSWSPIAYFVAQFIGEHVTDQCLIRERCIKNPFGLFGKSEK